MHVVRRTRHVAELVALRLALPWWFAAKPLDELLERLTRAVGAPRARERIPLHRGDLLRAERGVARIPWVSRTCLYRALARYALLRRNGADATFVMAIDKKGVSENGHAWVELEGRPFEEMDDVGRYVVTFRYPPAASDGSLEPL